MLKLAITVGISLCFVAVQIPVSVWLAKRSARKAAEQAVKELMCDKKIIRKP